LFPSKNQFELSRAIFPIRGPYYKRGHGRCLRTVKEYRRKAANYANTITTPCLPSRAEIRRRNGIGCLGSNKKDLHKSSRLRILPHLFAQFNAREHPPSVENKVRSGHLNLGVQAYALQLSVAKVVWLTDLRAVDSGVRSEFKL